MTIEAISSVKPNLVNKNVNFTSESQMAKEPKDNKAGKILLGTTLSALAVGGMYLLTKKRIKPSPLETSLLKTRFRLAKDWSFKNISKVKEKTVDGVKKYFINGNDVTDLVQCKQANRFLKNAKKQNQEILSDVIMTYKGDSKCSYRVITKRLNDGVTVCETYSSGGYGLCQREIVGKDFAKCFQGKSFSGKLQPHEGIVILDRNHQLLKFGTGIKEGKEIVITPYHLSEFRFTECANARNPRYLELLESGDITNPSKIIHDYQNHWFH